MKLLDLFCGAGGASIGYSRAGFDVTGVDIRPLQKQYPFKFIQADALELDDDFLRMFDAIHASPPCQFATALKSAPNAKEHPNLIPHTRELLIASGKPYVIENVERAREHLVNPILLCGTMFDLHAMVGDVRYNLERHRLFESNVMILTPGCLHTQGAPVVGVYGGHARCRAMSWGGRKTADFPGYDQSEIAAEAMDLFLPLSALSQAIPPAYTEYVGRFLYRACIKGLYDNG